VIGVALERKTDPNPKKTVENYVSKNGINYINFVGSEEVITKLTQTYGGITNVPTTYLVNKDNEIFEKIVGARSKIQFQQSINKMMK
jgi:hypothetical protein